MKEDDADSPGMDIPLAEMIQNLRQELICAQVQAEDQRIRFELEKVELELKVVVARTGKGQGGIKFWVVSAGGEYEKKSETSHTIKLTLNTIDSYTNTKVVISDKTSEKPLRN
jgi:hypothetical protein